MQVGISGALLVISSEAGYVAWSHLLGPYELINDYHIEVTNEKHPDEPRPEGFHAD